MNCRLNINILIKGVTIGSSGHYNGNYALFAEIFEDEKNLCVCLKIFEQNVKTEIARPAGIG